MLVHSFIQSDYSLSPVMVEVVLVPGTPKIQILGLADRGITESSQRIITALRQQGFKIPPGKQVIVNLHPHHSRKTSQGLDLAIALGILRESEQIPEEDVNLNTSFVYGQLTLNGEVKVPKDMERLNFEKPTWPVLSGPSETQWSFPVYELNELKQIKDLKKKSPKDIAMSIQRPELDSSLLFNEKLAELLEIVAVGEHSLLIAGDAGAGKTTLVESVVPLLRRPAEKTFRQALKYWRLSGRELNWRPHVQPHHSITPMAMIGGGRPPRPGEITLAHGGALLLDELLEFHPNVQAALREPMEKGWIHVSRGGERKIFPAQTLVLATTNLCKCGLFHPKNPYRCRCSSMQLRKYLERLSGPFLDRFTIFHLIQGGQKDGKISLAEILERVEATQAFIQEQREQGPPNERLPEALIYPQLEKGLTEEWLPITNSRRRKGALLKVARTLADRDRSPKIQQCHLERASHWTGKDFHHLQSFQFNDFAMR